MPQPKYKLIYFDARGKAELIRWMFKHASEPFEEVHIRELPHYLTPNHTADGFEINSALPYDQLPVLEVDGKLLGQTHAIVRYLAQQFNLVGKDEWEAAELDAFATFFFTEIEAPLMVCIRVKSPAFKQELLAEANRLMPLCLQKIETIMSKSKSGFLVGESATWVDFVVANFAEWLDHHDKDVYHKFPWIDQHYKRVTDLPGLKEWIASRAVQAT